MKYILIIIICILATFCTKESEVQLPEGSKVSINDGTSIFGAAKMVKFISKDSLLIVGKYNIVGLFVNEEFSHFIGRKGNGPGEYESISDLHFYRNKVYIFSAGKGLLQYFDVKNGEYMGFIKIETDSINFNSLNKMLVTSDNIYFMNNSYTRLENDLFPFLVRYNILSKKMKVLLQISDVRNEINPMEYGNSLKPFQFENNIYLTYPHMDEIIVYNELNQSIKRIPIPIYKEDIDKLKSMKKSGKFDGDGGYMVFWDYFERPDRFVSINDNYIIYNSQIKLKSHLINKLYLIDVINGQYVSKSEYKEMLFYWADSSDYYFYDWANQEENQILKIVKVPHGIK